jgi:hypothetical protein
MTDQPQNQMTHEMARALADAGYMTIAEYIRLCEENGWVVF